MVDEDVEEECHQGGLQFLHRETKCMLYIHPRDSLVSPMHALQNNCLHAESSHEFGAGPVVHDKCPACKKTNIQLIGLI